MDYHRSLSYLNSFLNLERITWTAKNRLWNLDRMRFLLKAFDHPERGFFPVLIAGTKGKGSTGFFLESILKAGGIRVGFYCSPHLEDVRERIRIDARMLSRSRWAKGIGEIRRRLKPLRLPSSLGVFTYFELMTLLAVLFFKQAKVKIGIFEVGMGGRFDATNALNAPLVILTPIHLDHEELLGSTIPAIAKEKAAVIHRGACVVTKKQSPRALKVIRARVRAVGAGLFRPPSLRGQRVGLLGDFQRDNAGAALKAAGILSGRFGLPISAKTAARGIQKTGWPGRIEVLRDRPTLILDGAHNPASTEALVRNLRALYGKRKNRVLIFGVSRDKKFAKMLGSLSRFFPEAVLAPLPTPRSQEMETLLLTARRHFRRVFPAADVREALAVAKNRMAEDGLGVATGSFYLVGEARRILRSA